MMAEPLLVQSGHRSKPSSSWDGALSFSSAYPASSSVNRTGKNVPRDDLSFYQKCI